MNKILNALARLLDATCLEERPTDAQCDAWRAAAADGGQEEAKLRARVRELEAERDELIASHEACSVANADGAMQLTAARAEIARLTPLVADGGGRLDALISAVALVRDECERRSIQHKGFLRVAERLTAAIEPPPESPEAAPVSPCYVGTVRGDGMMCCKNCGAGVIRIRTYEREPLVLDDDEPEAAEQGAALTCDHRTHWHYASARHVYTCGGCGADMPITAEQARKLPYDPSAGHRGHTEKTHDR